MLSLSEAYIEQLILVRFYEEIDSTTDKNCKNVLNKLCKLFALDTLEKNKGWFLENDYVTGSKTKAIRRVSNKLIQELRPDVLTLVNSFNIPQELLGAEIVKQ